MDVTSVAKKKTGRFEMKAEPDWLARMTAEAERLGLSLAGYARLAMNEKYERDQKRRTEPLEREE